MFSIAAEESVKRGYDGYMYGFAANEKVLSHYCNVFGAEYIGVIHKYHFVIDDMNARKLMEVYNYDRE